MPVSRQPAMAGFEGQALGLRLDVPPSQLAEARANVRHHTDDDIDARALAKPGAVDRAFGLARDLQRFLRRYIAQLEPGLTITDGGREQIVASGRIQITARDREGTIVVIELKEGEADGDAIARSLAHMGDLMTNGASVRGVLVAGHFTPCAISAARAVPNLRLVQYGFRFLFEPVALSPL